MESRWGVLLVDMVRHLEAEATSAATKPKLIWHCDSQRGSHMAFSDALWYGYRWTFLSPT